MSVQSKSSLGAAGLALLLCGQMLPLIDVSIINVALNAIAQSLSASQTELELLMSLYSLALAITLAMAGRAGDRFGRRRIMNVGVGLFGIASLFCGLSTTMEWMLVGRFFQGIAGGLIVPQVLATIHVSLSGRAHSNAIGIFGAVIGMAFLTGQILGGWIVALDLWGTGWRGVFLINIPICLLVLSLGPRWIPQTRSDTPSGFDISGTLLLATSVLLILTPLAFGPLLHWPVWAFVSILLGLALLPFFYRLESVKEANGRSPLVPPSLLKLASMQFGMVLAILFFSYVSGLMFLLAVTFQIGLGMTSQESGNTFIACGIAFFVSSYLSARISAYIGVLVTAIVGSLMTLAGLFWFKLTLAEIWPVADQLALAGSTAMLGFGQALVLSSFFRVGLSQVPVAMAGSGSAVLTTTQQVCLSLGPALYGAILHQGSSSSGLLEGLQNAYSAQLIAIGLLSLVAVGYYLFSNRYRGATQSV